MRPRNPVQLWVSSATLRAMEAEATLKHPLETGGLLMGYNAPSQGAIVVTNIIGPGPDAVHGTNYFIPDHAYHEREVALVYAATGAGTLYLGDWHSHPNGTPHLSKRDRATLRRIALSHEAGVPAPLMAVVGGGPGTISSWRFAFFQACLPRRILGWSLLRVTEPEVTVFQRNEY